MEWIDTKIEPPSKEFPIIVYDKFHEIPTIVRWVEEDEYDCPGFIEGNGEYSCKLEHIEFWMPAPKPPKGKL